MDNIISVKNISKTYKMGEVKIRALRDVSLDIKRGEFLIITGRNGSGKSTLLHQLGLLDTPDKGSIVLNGREVVGLSESKRSGLRLEYLGYIFQEYALVPELTALQNVMLPALARGAKDCKAKAKELLLKLDLSQREDNLPRQLSGGEQQKVAIARALINDPAILFADEPTANLDSTISKEIMEIFKHLNEKDGRTMVMITHEPEETKYASRVIKLSDGRII